MIAPPAPSSALRTPETPADPLAADKALRESEARFRSALNAGRLGSWETDYEQMSRTWSAEGMALFGLDLPNGRGQVGGVDDEYVNALHPEDRHLAQGFRALADKQDSFPAEYRIVRPDGTTLWLSGRGLVVERGADGRATRLVSIMADASDRKHADRQKDEFIATLAHELRNPLAPIRNAVNLLKQSGSADPRLMWCHDVIDRQARQMAHLLDDLLDVSRLSRHQLKLEVEPLLLSDVIRRAVEAAQPMIDAGRHTLTLNTLVEPLPLQGDLMRLAQVVSNVLVNAAKITPSKGRLTLTVERNARQAIVKVSDSGAGIAPKHLAQGFEGLDKVGSALNRAQGGHGIGLFLAKGLVELHGGTISARSQGEGQGSEFEIRLSLDSSAATEGPTDRMPPPAVPVDESFRVLIADDLRDIADSLALLLEDMGHEVHVAYDGEQALHMAEEWQPDVVLLDLGMPKMHGYDVCRNIRTAAWGHGMTLIAQTGWGQENDRRRTREAGFDHHVTKPVQIEDLVTLFRRRPQSA